MARLPTYNNQVGLDTGADTFRTAPNVGAAIGNGMNDFGRALLSTGDMLGKAQLRLEATETARQERDAAYRDELEYRLLGDRIQQFELQNRDKIGDDGLGHTRSVEDFAQDEYQKLLASGRLSKQSVAKHDLAFDKVRNGIVDKAATYEAQTNQKFRSDILEAKVKDLTASAGVHGAMSVDALSKDWTEFVTRTEGTETRLGRKVLELGLKRIEQQAFKAEAYKRGTEFTGQFQGLVSDNPSATSGNALVDATLRHAPANGIDPKVGVAIGWIESRLNANAGKPIGRDGRPMSSAEGGWQILDGVARDFKLTPEEKRDPEKATAAVMRHFAQNQSRITSLGQQATPGKLYMYWNVGQGVAERIMANPNAPIEQIIYSAYPSRPGFAAQVLRNNPSMYRAGMTGGEVMANYERQMERAQQATTGYFNGTRVQSDESTKAAVSAFMGRDMKHITTADLVETFGDVMKNVKEATAEDRNIAEGEMHLTSPGFNDPYDPHYRKVINAAVGARVQDSVVQGIATGDPQAYAVGREFTDRAGFVPDKVLHGYRAALDSGSTEKSMLALQSLSRLEADNPIAFKATSFQADEKDMVHSYRAMTETLGLDPATAAKEVLFYRTPEGKKQRQAMADKTRAEWRNGGSDADAETAAWSEVQKAFDKSIFSTPDTATDVQREAIVEAYRQGIVYERLQGFDGPTAKARAIKTLEKIWGVSGVGDSTRSQTLMPLAPEKVLGPNRAIDGSFKWVADQAKNVLFQYHVDRGEAKDDPDTRGYFSPEMKLVPKPGAVTDYLTGRPVSYDIYYRDRRGMIQVAVGTSFTPNYEDAKRAADEKFRAARAQRTTTTGAPDSLAMPTP